jgi:glycerophosphoryl diester phosphodiesterase
MRSSPSKPDPLDPGPRGFAHRGLHFDAGSPENSFAAFKAAVEFGAGIECDLRLTADDQVLVFHDSDTWRICSSHLLVGRSTHTELSRLRVGDAPIPTLENLLELVKGQVPLLLEIKVDGDLWRWMPALKRALRDYRGRHGVMSFDPRISRLLKTRFPRVRRGLVIRNSLPPVQRQLALALADPHFLAVERTALGKSWVAAERKRRPVYSWTIRGPQQRLQAQVHADALIWEADGRP